MTRVMMKSATLFVFTKAAVMDLIMLDSYPRAICNDGSWAGYYFKKSESNSNDWLIF
jgi:hypothetical protein